MTELLLKILLCAK